MRRSHPLHMNHQQLVIFEMKYLNSKTNRCTFMYYCTDCFIALLTSIASCADGTAVQYLLNMLGFWANELSNCNRQNAIQIAKYFFYPEVALNLNLTVTSSTKFKWNAWRLLLGLPNTQHHDMMQNLSAFWVISVVFHAVHNWISRIRQTNMSH